MPLPFYSPPRLPPGFCIIMAACMPAETIFSIIAKAQPPARKTAPSGKEIGDLIRLRKVDAPLGPRLIVTTQRKGYRVEKLEFLSEPGIYIPVWVFLPDGAAATSRATLYVNEAGKQSDGLEFGLYERLARKGELILAVDVRGVGETRPPHSQQGERRNEFVAERRRYEEPHGSISSSWSSPISMTSTNRPPTNCADRRRPSCLNPTFS